MATLKYAWAVVFSLLLLGMIEQGKLGVEASHQVFPEFQFVQALNVSQEQRPAYHFQPKKNWMNDPNGPMYYNGIYHLFYQYNPNGSVWGNIVWAHSISTDLINWTPLDPAIYPTKPFDINGCWSGSATILPRNKPVMLYTGVDSQNRQVQNIAVPKNFSDRYLKEWVKPDYNPLIVPGNGINVSQFRDPSTAWLGKDGHWRVLVGSRRNNTGMAVLYKSIDFKFWREVQHPFHSSAGTGMWECPDFYPVTSQGKFGSETPMNSISVKHVLKVSLDNTRFDYYTVGRYFEQLDRYVPDNTSADNATGLRYDYGNFYASKTFYDSSKKRRILWGWANESDTKENDISKGWAGIQTIPRKVWLDGSGKQLLQWPIDEITTLRGSEVQLNGLYLTKGDHHEVQRITAAQADVEVTFHIPHLDKAEPFDSAWVDPQQLCGQKGATVKGGVGPFGLLTLASKNLEEYLPVFFRVFKANNKHVVLMCSDQSRSSLRPEVYKPSFGGFVDVDLSNGLISLRSLIDHSVVESFGAGGKTCITSRVYPSLAMGENAHLFAFNNGTQAIEILKLSAWNMNKP